MRAIVPVIIAMLMWTACGDAFAVEPAPVGHRQPNASNLPAQVLREEQGIDVGDSKLDTQLNICRGC